MAKTKVAGPQVQEMAEAAGGLVHPLLSPRRETHKLGGKQRRTMIRTVKLINDHTDSGDANLVQVSISRGTNNQGLEGPEAAMAALRYALQGGLKWPHEYDPVKYPFIMCACRDCFDPIVAGSERCKYHEQEWQERGPLYAV